MQFIEREVRRNCCDKPLMQPYLAMMILMLQIVVIFGCRSASPPPPVVGFDTPGIKKVLVLPIKNMSQLFGENVSVRSPISGKVFVTGEVKGGADDLLTRLLLTEVSHLESYELIPPEQTQGVIASTQAPELNEQNRHLLVTHIGKQLGADVVLVGHLFRFKDRVGEKYAAESPASVAFDLNMINTQNGALIWTGHFDETQQALNENLFLIGRFIKRGGAWVTGEEMAAAGLADLVQKLPKPKLTP